MVWKCPPLHLPNWNNLWKWKTDMIENNEDKCTCEEQEYYTTCPYAEDIYEETRECSCCPYCRQQCLESI